MGRKRRSGYGEQERVLTAIDVKDQIKCLSLEEQKAFLVAYFMENPNETMTRDRAMVLLRKAAANKEMAKITLNSIAGEVSKDDKEYILPKAPKEDKLSVDMTVAPRIDEKEAEILENLGRSYFEMKYGSDANNE